MNILAWEQNRKIKWAIAVSLIFHIIGIVGIVWIDQSRFAAMTPMNLLLSLTLILWSQEKFDFSFFIFFLVAFQTGFFTEYLGVNHQLLFGHYRYEEALGLKFFGVPLMIGVNWFIMVYCSAFTAQILLDFVSTNTSFKVVVESKFWGEVLFVITGALLLMGFDWIMEPVAVKLGFWTWLSDGVIPLNNYRDWFLVSIFLLWILKALKIRIQNQFAHYLLLIQFLFFVFLRFIL
jgi:putative membrane protein